MVPSLTRPLPFSSATVRNRTVPFRSPTAALQLPTVLPEWSDTGIAASNCNACVAIRTPAVPDWWSADGNRVGAALDCNSAVGKRRVESWRFEG